MANFGNTNITSTAQIQTPNDYIEKGINELTMDYYSSVVSPSQKRTIGNFFVGVGLLIVSNVVKTITVSLVTENKKNIHKAILDTFELINFTNLSNLTWWTIHNVKYYTFGWMFKPSNEMKYRSDSNYLPDYNSIEIQPPEHFVDMMKILLDKSKQDTIADISNITFDCDISDEIKMNEKDVVLTKIYKNISLQYKELDIQFPSLSGREGGIETMYDILNFKYPDIDYNILNAYKIEFDSYGKDSFTGKTNVLYLRIYKEHYQIGISFYCNPEEFKSNTNKGIQDLRTAVHQCLNNDMYVKELTPSYYCMFNLLIIKILFASDSLLSSTIQNIPKCKTSKIGTSWYMYNKIKTLINATNNISSNDYLGKEICNKLRLKNYFYKSKLFKKVLNFSYDYDKDMPITDENASASTMTVYLKGTKDKQLAYTTFQSFVSHLHTISKRQNTNNKIHVKTIQFKESIIEGKSNPAYSTYIEHKKQLLDEKRSLADTIALIGMEPSKTLESIVKREIESLEISERYCSFDNLYLRKEQDTVLYNVVESFQNDKKIMEELGIPNKLGVLLHGLPGCGKTTTILTIASYFGRDVFYINLKSVKTNEELKQVFDYVNSKHVGGGIIVFEDIDAMTDATNKRTNAVAEKSTWELVEENNSITLEYLLNLLDGMLTYNDSIVIITTNLLNKLDPKNYTRKNGTCFHSIL